MILLVFFNDLVVINRAEVNQSEHAVFRQAL
jgi:hypothetical protein